MNYCEQSTWRGSGSLRYELSDHDHVRTEFGGWNLIPVRRQSYLWRVRR